MDCWEIQSGKQLNYIIIQLLVHLLLLCKKFGLKCLCNLLEINYTHIHISIFFQFLHNLVAVNHSVSYWCQLSYRKPNRADT